jgi:hypothetical protein
MYIDTKPTYIGIENNQIVVKMPYNVEHLHNLFEIMDEETQLNKKAEEELKLYIQQLQTSEPSEIINFKGFIKKLNIPIQHISIKELIKYNYRTLFEAYDFLKEFNLLKKEDVEVLKKRVEQIISDRYCLEDWEFEDIKIAILGVMNREELKKDGIKILKNAIRKMIESEEFLNCEVDNWLKSRKSHNYVHTLLHIFRVLFENELTKEFEEEIKLFRDKIYNSKYKNRIIASLKRRIRDKKYVEEINILIRIIDDATLLKYLL